MAAAMFPREAEKLGPYELVTELASGGMATVFLARRPGLGGFSRSVAIKRLRAEIAQAPPFLAMLIDEARLAARIHHPNVAATLEFASEGDEHYLVMEYVEGGSFLDLLGRAADRGESVPPRVVLRVVLDALAGLHAAHELTGDDGVPLDLVHRDLSPHNLMVGLDGCTRIVDFGLARAASRLTKTAVGTLKGKLAYMSPEQLHQRPLDRRADLFALGVVLWEGLRGERLFRAENDVATIERVLRGDIPSLRATLPWLSTGVNAVVMRALARNPGTRFSTAEEMGAALSDAAEATNLVGSRREVSSCVARLLGEQLAARRDLLRSWVETHEPEARPSLTQLCFSAEASSQENPRADEVSAEHPPAVLVGSSSVLGRRAAPDPCEGFDPFDTSRFALPGAAPGALARAKGVRMKGEIYGEKDVLESLAPSTANEPTAILPRRRPRRSLSPMIGGAAVGLCAIVVALVARSGWSVDSLQAAGSSAELAPETLVAIPPVAPRPVEAPAPPPVTEIVATPDTAIIAAPEPSASQTTPTRNVRPGGTAGRRAPPATRPAPPPPRPRDPDDDEAPLPPPPQRDLDNPYK